MEMGKCRACLATLHGHGMGEHASQYSMLPLKTCNPSAKMATDDPRQVVLAEHPANARRMLPPTFAWYWPDAGLAFLGACGKTARTLAKIARRLTNTCSPNALNLNERHIRRTRGGSRHGLGGDFYTLRMDRR